MTTYQFLIKKAHLNDCEEDSSSIIAEAEWNDAVRERNHRIETGKAIFCYLSCGGSKVLESPVGVNFIQKMERDLAREAAEAIRALYQE
jgi:hypothetical protein